MLTFSVKMFYLIKGLKNFKAGGPSECQFPATYMAFWKYLIHVSSNPKNALLNLCYGVSCKFSGDFWVPLEGNSFS